MTSQLQRIIESLKARDDVDAVMLTGSYGVNNRPYSDIDLVIILSDTAAPLKALYTWIDGTFADIFFFNKKDLEDVNNSAWLPSNSSNLLGSLYVWTRKGHIQFDKSGLLTELKTKEIKLETIEDQQLEYWHGINYNYESNTRYFDSGDPAYHEALEMRLLYSIPQLITGYFAFRNIPWEGEKTAFAFLKKHDFGLYQEFDNFIQSNTIENRFLHYGNMVKMTLTPDFYLWKRNEILPQPKGRPAKLSEPELNAYWEKLIS